MKIHSTIGIKVLRAEEDYRKALVNATIELIKMIGAESGQDVAFNSNIYLFENKKNSSSVHVADMIGYCDNKNNPYYIVYLNGEAVTSSTFLSTDNMKIIYNAVREVVRNY